MLCSRCFQQCNRHKSKTRNTTTEKENTFITEHNMTTYTSYRFLTYLTTDTKVEREDVHILRAGVETASIPIFFLSSFFSK